MMRGGNGERAAQAKFFEERDGERRALFGGSSRAHFVDENQRAIGGHIEHRFQVEHMRRKGGKIGRNRLFIADVRKNAIEDRQFGAAGGNGNRRLSRERGEPDRFQGDCLAARVWSADHHYGAARFGTERELQWHSGAAVTPKGRLQHRIARLLQLQEVTCRKRRNGAIEIASKTSTRENRIQVRNAFRRRRERASLCPHAVSEFVENARNFDDFILTKLDEPIIQLNGFERLEKNRLPAGAGTVHHALYRTSVRSAHRNHETIIAQRDVAFAARFAAPLQNAFQRALNGATRLDHAGANAFQMWRGVVGNFAVRQYRSANRG